MDIIKSIEQENLNPNAPKFEVGDSVRVYFKVIEGNKERVQAYEGIVIARKHGGFNETFTVRRISNRATFTVRKNSNGIGVERTFPVHSPKIEKVEVVRSGKVRRAKLYYLRNRTGKAAKVKGTIN